MNQLRESKYYTMYLTRIAVLTAIALILMVLEFPIAFIFPAWLPFDFSDTIAVVGGIIMGPISAIAIEILKNLMKVILGLSNSGGIGELANAIAGIFYVVPVVVVYNRMRTTKGLIIGMIAGTISMAVAACAANYLFVLDLYMADLTPSVKWDMIKTIFIPFNLFKATLESIVAFIIVNYMKGVIKFLRIEAD